MKDAGYKQALMENVNPADPIFKAMQKATNNDIKGILDEGAKSLNHDLNLRDPTGISQALGMIKQYAASHDGSLHYSHSDGEYQN